MFEKVVNLLEVSVPKCEQSGILGPSIMILFKIIYVGSIVQICILITIIDLSIFKLLNPACRSTQPPVGERGGFDKINVS